MIYNKKFNGQYTIIRPVYQTDAESTLKMRLDLDKAKYLHPVENNINKQRQWIANQIKRPGDYYFLALSKEDDPIGTFSIYNIENEKGYSGRLLMFGNALQSYEVNIMVFRFAFEYLNLKLINGDVDVRNEKAIRFDKQFGFDFESPVPSPDLDGRMVRYCTLTKESFYGNLNAIYHKVYRKLAVPVMPWRIINERFTIGDDYYRQL